MKILPSGLLGTTPLLFGRREERADSRDRIRPGGRGSRRGLRHRKRDQSHRDNDVDRDRHGDEQRCLDGRRSERDVHGAGVFIASCTGVHGLAHPLPSLHELHHVERLTSRVKRQGLLRRDATGGIVELDHLHNLHRLVRQLDSILRESLLVGERAPDLSATIRDSSGGGATNPSTRGATLPCLAALSCSSDTLKSGSAARPSGEKRWAS